MFAALVAVALAQTPDPAHLTGPIFSSPARLNHIPNFSFAPANGKGIGTACSGAAVTGAKNEPVTFTRASTRTCLTGPEVYGIKAGDMVTLSSNQPAAMPGGDGTGSVGLNTWPARTNWTRRSAQFDDALWVQFGTFTPTVTADQALAPDNTLTADRVVFPATAAGQNSFVYQDTSCRIGTNSASVFVAAWDGGSGTLDMCIDDGATGWLVHYCAYGVTADGGALGLAADGGHLYTRCLMENFPESAEGTNMLFAIGNCSGLTSVARANNDVLLFGAQCETGINASPYIPTGGDAGIRAAEVATASYTAAGSSMSMSLNYTPASPPSDRTAQLTLSFDSANWSAVDSVGAKAMCNFVLPDAGTADGGAALNGVGNFLAPSPSLAACRYAPNNITACSGGYCMKSSATATLQTGVATVYLGGQLDGGAAEGTVKNICIDGSSTRCGSPASLVTCPTDEPSTVALVGDSIMVGAFDVKMVDEIRDQLCPTGRSAVNFAVSGSGIPECVTQYHASVKGHAYRAVATNCGTNTLSGTGGDVAGTWAQMESFLNDITRDGGFHVVLGNLTPCRGNSNCGGGGGSGYLNVATFNAMEANWCADAGSLATCIDNNTLLGSGLRSYVTNPTNASDGFFANPCLPSSDDLHPNNYCTTKLADAFAGAMP